MSDEAAALVLQAREEGARDQARGRAAQDRVCPRELLNFLEDVLLDFQVLKDTFLQGKRKQKLKLKTDKKRPKTKCKYGWCLGKKG